MRMRMDRREEERFVEQMRDDRKFEEVVGG